MNGWHYELLCVTVRCSQARGEFAECIMNYFVRQYIAVRPVKKIVDDTMNYFMWLYIAVRPVKKIVDDTMNYFMWLYIADRPVVRLLMTRWTTLYKCTLPIGLW